MDCVQSCLNFATEMSGVASLAAAADMPAFKVTRAYLPRYGDCVARYIHRGFTYGEWHRRLLIFPYNIEASVITLFRCCVPSPSVFPHHMYMPDGNKETRNGRIAQGLRAATAPRLQRMRAQIKKRIWRLPYPRRKSGWYGRTGQIRTHLRPSNPKSTLCLYIPPGADFGMGFCSSIFTQKLNLALCGNNSICHMLAKMDSRTSTSWVVEDIGVVLSI